MGRINPRLSRRYDAVKPDIPLPVIVVTNKKPDQPLLAEALKTGIGPIKYISEIGLSYGTLATKTVADRLAGLPSTVEVFYDEPIAAYPGR